MKDENRTKERLIQELVKLRRKIADLEEITVEERQVKKKLKESEKKYKDLVEETPIGIINIEIIGKITYINKRLEKLSGYSREEIVGKNVFKLGIFPDEMLKILKERLKVRLKRGSTRQRREIRFKCKDGKWMWIEITAKLIKKWGIPASFRITVQDITNRKRTEDILQESEKKYRELVQNTNSIILRMNINGCITFFNEFAQKFFGYTKDEILGKNVVGTIVPGMDTSYRDLKAMIKDIIQNPDLYTINENENIRRNGERVWIAWTNKGAIDKDGHITEILCIGNDITERKKLEEELKKLARFDNLTGSCNRGYGLDLLDRQLKLARRRKTSVLLAYTDVDDFKDINDTLGHEEGDKVLKEVVKLLKSTLREIDIICRMGGDEFLLIFPDSSLKDSTLIKERLNKNLIKLNQTLKKFYKIELSMGLSCYDPNNPQSIDELIRIADKKMYEEKSSKNKKRRK